VTEDELSMAIARRAVRASGRNFEVSRFFVERGVGNIKRSMSKYRQACHAVPHVVLADLDQEECPVALRSNWGIRNLPSTLLFNVAVREIESWLLADRNGLAKFLGVPVNKVPTNVEDERHPKEKLMAIARGSRNRRLASELVPAAGSRASKGPLYNERLSAFVATDWNLDAACAGSPSLERLLQRLQQFLA
jgi:hypothetical protein